MARFALLEYFFGESRNLGFVILPGAPRPFVFPLETDRGERLTAQHLQLCASRLLIDFHGLPPDWSSEAPKYLEALALPPCVKAAKRLDVARHEYLQDPRFRYTLDYWQNLSSALLPPPVRRLIEDQELLCIIPHGPLYALPFAALRWSEAEYVAERFGICYAPSATVLGMCQAKSAVRRMMMHRPTKSIVVAVNAPEDGEGSLETDVSEMVPVLARAAKTATVTVLRGRTANSHAPASKTEVLRNLNGHHVIHFACHGMFGLDMEDALSLDSGLLLSDGSSIPKVREVPQLPKEQLHRYLLTAREIFGLRLEADLVTLRACSSARVEVRTGDEITGLIRAFIYAGTPSVIASMWNCHKASSQQLLRAFYANWLAEPRRHAKWRSLQEAQRSLINSEYSHPYHWAAFALVGDWL